jgi:ubiquinone biosynthesis protein UbiJ
VDVRATKKWCEENAPLTFEETKKWRYLLEENVGTLRWEPINMRPDTLQLLVDVLTHLKGTGDYAIEIQTGNLQFLRYRSQEEVMAHEEELRGRTDGE